VGEATHGDLFANPADSDRDIGRAPSPLRFRHERARGQAICVRAGALPSTPSVVSVRSKCTAITMQRWEREERRAFENLEASRAEASTSRVDFYRSLLTRALLDELEIIRDRAQRVLFLFAHLRSDSRNHSRIPAPCRVLLRPRQLSRSIRHLINGPILSTSARGGAVLGAE